MSMIKKFWSRYYHIVIAVSFLASLFVVVGYYWSPSHTTGDEHGKMNFLDMNWDEHYYGAGDGVPIIIYGARGRYFRDYNDFAQDLNAAGFRTLVLEQVGLNMRRIDRTYGETTRIVIRYVYASLFQDRTEIVTDSPLHAPYCLIGHGFGGDVMREVVAYEGKYKADGIVKPKALILMSPLADNAKSPEIIQDVNRVFNGLLPPWVRWSAAKRAYFSPESKLPDNWKIGWNKSRSVNRFWPRDTSSLTTWSDEDQIPVLALIGTENAIYNVDDVKASLAAQNIRNVEFAIVQNSGHAMLPEQPNVVANKVIDFLNEHCHP